MFFKPVLKCTCWLPLLQGEKRSACIPTYRVQHPCVCMCVYIFCTVFLCCDGERKHASLFLNEQRKPREEAAGAATSAREGESGAEGDHNRGRGSALNDQGRSPGYPNRKSRAGLATETRVSHSPRSPKKSHSDEVGLRLGREGKPAGQVQRGTWLSMDELQCSSRDITAKAQLKCCSWGKKRKEECLQWGFSWLFTALTGLFLQPPDPRLQLYHRRAGLGHGQPTPTRGVHAEPWHGVLCFGISWYRGTTEKSVYSSMKRYVATLRK